MRTIVLLLAAVLSRPLFAQGVTAILLNVQKGEMPSDASVPVALTADFPEKADGVSLKVTCGDGAFGQYNPRLRDWNGFTTLRFFAHNATDKPLPMYFALRDKSTVDYNTRADITFTLQPGPSNIALDLTKLKRNASPLQLDMSAVTQWFIANAEKADGAALYFGDFVLESAAAAPAAAPAVGLSVAPGGGGGNRIIIEGKIRIEIDEATFRNLLAGGAIAAAAPTVEPAAVTPAAGGEKKVLVDLNAPLPFEATEGSTMEVSEDHAAELGGKSVKFVYAKAESALSMGYWGGPYPNGCDWSGYNALRFEAFNATDKVLSLYVAIRDKNAGYENRADMAFKLNPGLNRIEFPINTIVTNSGKQLNKSQVTQWFISCDQAATVYFANFRLEK